MSRPCLLALGRLFSRHLGLRAHLRSAVRYADRPVPRWTSPPCVLLALRMLCSRVVPSKPFQDQEPGTSGLRKPVKTYQLPGYTENFIEATLKAVGPQLEGAVLVLGGDGRYYCKEAACKVLRIAAAHKVKKVYVGKDGILSTPAASNLIRKTSAVGGIILTASHNPGGPDADFGIKYNLSNGGAAPTSVTNKIFEISKTITEYSIVPDLCCPLDTIGSYSFKVDGREFEVCVIDPVQDYLELMKDIFDFPKLKTFLSDRRCPFRIILDSMYGVTGPYCKRIFEDELGAVEGSVLHGVPLEDFGGGHPDPNLEYAKDLVKLLNEGTHDFGAAFDGDGDRNMILGKNAFFVTPSDSLAILADHINLIPYFQKNGVKGFARSMPTAAAIDRVGEALKIPVYETPTGWKFFCNLLDGDKLSLCGEESFGTGSSHIREKDGIWAVLAWLTVLADTRMSVEEIVTSHWKKYGRNFTLRYDYEAVDAKAAKDLMASLETKISSDSFKGTVLGDGAIEYKVKFGDNFSYTDITDNSVTSKQGLRVVMEDGSRIVYRLSGTGSQGATIRIYIELYESDPNRVPLDRIQTLRPLCNIAVNLARIAEFTGRNAPTVIT